MHKRERPDSAYPRVEQNQKRDIHFSWHTCLQESDQWVTLPSACPIEVWLYCTTPGDMRCLFCGSEKAFPSWHFWVAYLPAQFNVKCNNCLSFFSFEIGRIVTEQYDKSAGEGGGLKGIQFEFNKTNILFSSPISFHVPMSRHYYKIKKKTRTCCNSEPKNTLS